MKLNDPQIVKRSDELSYRIIGAALDVHRRLGPGLIEPVYEEFLCYEFSLRKIHFERQKPLLIVYKGFRLDCGYRLDIVVDKLVILELKAVERIKPLHEAQLRTYLKLSGLWLGLLINFNVEVLKDGIRRMVN
jgi:GxxExxY protein